MNEALILVVDEQDVPIGSASKEEAQRDGLIHRIVHVIVEDPDGNIMLQKRSPNAKIHANWWDPAVGGHVDAGEDYETAALREMAEEIGLKDVTLAELGKYRRSSVVDSKRLNRFYKVYKAVVSRDAVFTPAQDEVAELRWFTRDEVSELIHTSDTVTAPLKEALARFYDIS